MRGGVYLTGGTAKGTKLFSVSGSDVRPATSRMRISLFDILRSRAEGARAVDLFAGTGSLGLEALSRGATFCHFFDTDSRCISVLGRNIEKLRFADRARIHRDNAFHAHKIVRDDVDLVFLDPPYPFYRERREELLSLGEAWSTSAHFQEDALLLVEHPPGQGFEESFGDLRRVDERSYGGTVVTFYAKPSR